MTTNPKLTEKETSTEDVSGRYFIDWAVADDVQQARKTQRKRKVADSLEKGKGAAAVGDEEFIEGKVTESKGVVPTSRR